VKPVIPKPLRKGDLIGVAAVSGPVNTSNLEKGIEFFQKLGFRIKFGANIYNQFEYLAGSDKERSDGLNNLISDPNISGIFFARGGYGSMRILREIDYEAIKRRPRILMGMSDLTAVSMAVHHHCSLVTLAGPMLAGQISEVLDRDSEEFMIRALTEPLECFDMIGKLSSELKILRNGKTKGYLLGGCLSVLVSLLGTPYCPDFTDSVLFLEDVNEPAYKIDRMLTQMKLAGIFGSIQGVIIGHFSGNESDAPSSVAERIVMEYTEQGQIPVISNYPHGHALPNITLPVGALVEFEASGNQATLRCV
jgi:muramoyltetrapeptide carboxypeptidase